MRYVLQARRKGFVWLDPQRRCYNGAYGDHKYEWSGWETFDSQVAPDKVRETLRFWRDLNKIAVAGRGENAKIEYRIIKEE